MQYILKVGPWHVGPFTTHKAASWWAESHGVDGFTMLQLDDPAEAPGKVLRQRLAPLKHPMQREKARAANPGEHSSRPDTSPCWP